MVGAYRLARHYLSENQGVASMAAVAAWSGVNTLSSLNGHTINFSAGTNDPTALERPMVWTGF